jgi:hypothetical protein
MSTEKRRILGEIDNFTSKFGQGSVFRRLQDDKELRAEAERSQPGRHPVMPETLRPELDAQFMWPRFYAWLWYYLTGKGETPPTPDDFEAAFQKAERARVDAQMKQKAEAEKAKATQREADHAAAVAELRELAKA